MGGIETKTKASNDDWVVNIGVRMGAVCLARKGPRSNWRTVKLVRTGGLMANGRGLFPHLLTTEQRAKRGQRCGWSQSGLKMTGQQGR